MQILLLKISFNKQLPPPKKKKSGLVFVFTNVTNSLIKKAILVFPCYIQHTIHSSLDKENDWTINSLKHHLGWNDRFFLIGIFALFSCVLLWWCTFWASWWTQSLSSLVCYVYLGFIFAGSFSWTFLGYIILNTQKHTNIKKKEKKIISYIFKYQ